MCIRYRTTNNAGCTLSGEQKRRESPRVSIHPAATCRFRLFARNRLPAVSRWSWAVAEYHAIDADANEVPAAASKTHSEYFAVVVSVSNIVTSRTKTRPFVTFFKRPL